MVAHLKAVKDTFIFKGKTGDRVIYLAVNIAAKRLGIMMTYDFTLHKPLKLISIDLLFFLGWAQIFDFSSSIN